ncbi:MAG: FecR domain-containing protein [Pirellulales bacterium]|nr:FecR domain-containing protein [Pirellulales bacterium]
MKHASDFSRPIDDLLSKVLDGSLDDNEQEALADLLRRDPQARRLYHDHIALHALFHWKEGDVLTEVGEDFGLDLDVAAPDGAPVPLSALTSFNAPWHGVVGYFANHSFALSYLIAAMLLGVAMLISSMIYVSRPAEMADAGGASEARPQKIVFVGRVKNMVGCTWSDPATTAYAGSSVPLGRKYAMASGLMEIAYADGATVILQGPCEYEVESPAGGFLARGKLTAKIRTQNSKPEAQSSEPSPLFAVRTPTAVVVDLGTEFGVQVDENGDTASHVFRGSVRVNVEGASGQGIVLTESESLRIVTQKDRTFAMLRQAAQPDRFVRRMPAPGPIVLFEDGFDAPFEGENRVGKCFSRWTYAFGDGNATASIADPAGAASLRCLADAESAALVELAGRPECNFQPFAAMPTRITFTLLSGDGGLRNQDGYPHRKWVGVREAGAGDPQPSEPMALPGLYVTLALDGRHSAFNVNEEKPGNIVFVDLRGKKTFLASWDWTHYDGDGPQTVAITLTSDTYQVEFSDSEMKNLTGSLSGKLPSLGPAPVTTVVYCQGVQAPAGLTIDRVRVERLPPYVKQKDPDVRKEDGRP